MAINKTLQLKRKAKHYESLQAALNEMSGATISEGEPFLGYYEVGGVEHAVLGVGGLGGNHKLFFFDGAEIDSKIEAAINSLKADDIAYESGSSDTVVSASTNVDQAIKAIDAAIADIKSGEASYTIVSADTTGLGPNVKEAYQLQKTVGGVPEAVGETIKIYKDSALLAVQLGHEGARWNEETKAIVDDGGGQDALILAYEDKEGKVTVVAIPLGDFLRESEFKDGLQVKNSEVSVKLDDTGDSAKFLYMKKTSDENGAIALSGISEAIATAVSGAVDTLDATVGSTTVDDGKHVAVQVVEVDGKLTGVTVAEKDIASANALNDEIGYRKAVTGIDANAYTPNANTNYISGASITSLNAADIELDKQIKVNADAIAALEAAQISVSASTEPESAKYLTVSKSGTVFTVKVTGIDSAISEAVQALDVDDAAVPNQFVTSVSEVDGKISVTRGTVAASGVTASPITGDTAHAAVTGLNVAEQIESISKTLKSQGDAALTGVTSANGAISVGAASNNSQEIEFKLDKTSADNATSDLLSITSEGLMISNHVDMGTW